MDLSDNEDDAFASINKYLDQVEKAMDEPEVDDGSGFTRPASAGSGPKRAFEEAGTDDERQLVRRSTASRARWRSVGRDAVRDRERSRLVQDLDKKATLQREKMKAKDQEIESLTQQLLVKDDELRALEESKTDALKRNKQEHDVTLRRHLELIDRLLVDKGALSKRVISLTEQIKKLQQRYGEQVDRLKRKFTLEADRKIKMISAREKLERKKFERNKVEEIRKSLYKQMTPEIQILLDKQRNKERLLTQDFQNKLLKQQEDLRLKNDAEVRRAVAKTRQDIVEEHSRDLTRVTRELQEERSRCEVQMRDLRQQLEKDLMNERKKYQDELHKLEKQHREQLASADKEDERQKSALHDRFARNEAAMERKHQEDLAKQKATLLADKQEWQKRFTSKVEQDADDQLTGLEAKMQQEQRDRIERVVSRLTREYGDKESKITARHNSRIQKLEQNAERDRRKLKDTQQSYQEEVDELRKALLKLKDERQEKQSDIASLKENMGRRNREMDQLREIIRNYKDEAVNKQQQHDQKVKALHMEAEMQRQKLQGQLEVTQEKLEGQLRQRDADSEILRRKHENKFKDLMRKWKAIMNKKDDENRQLREELASTDIQLQQFQRHFSME